jgi:hypothetical protein
VAGVWQAGTSLGTIETLPVSGIARAGFDQAHAATGHDRQARMPAVVRNLDAGARAPECRSGARRRRFDFSCPSTMTFRGHGLSFQCEFVSVLSFGLKWA